MKKISYFTGYIISAVLFSYLNSQQLTEREIHYRPGDWISYPVTRFVTSIALGHRFAYFGTTGGIARYNFFSGRWEHPFTVSDGMEDDHVYIIEYDFRTSFLWCVTESGISFLNPASMEWRNVLYRDIGIFSIPLIGIGKSFVWLKSGKRFYRSDPVSGIFIDATFQEAREDSVVWKSTSSQKPKDLLPLFSMERGYIFDPQGIIYDNHMRAFRVTSMQQDSFDNLWIGTWGIGCGVADIKSSFLRLLSYGPFSSHIDAMVWDDGRMWMGGACSTDGQKGITLWDPVRGDWKYFEAKFITELRTDEVTSVAADTEFVWFGTEGGLAIFKKSDETWRFFDLFDNLWSDRVTCLALGEEKLWIGTESGINVLSLIEGRIKRVREDRLSHIRIFQIAVDGDDVWAGTEIGLFHYISSRKEWEHLRGFDAAAARIFSALSIWEEEVWCGTDDGIQVYYKSQNRWDGFPSSYFSNFSFVHSIVADSENVWAGTDGGVWKYVKSEDRWRRFTVDDGLLDNRVNWILLDGDYIWFGTDRGLTRFYWNAPYRKD